ncbi:MAG: hypothetical protein GX051_08815 [Clostridiales bacterium]|nr:hypothetical protein [Clostridiales bacterium]
MKKRTIFALGALSTIAAGAVISKKTTPEQRNRFSYDSADKGIRALLRGICSVLPERKWQLEEEYVPENFFSGYSEFLEKSGKQASWSLGYACEDLTPEDYQTHNYYIAGYLNYPPNLMQGVIDGQFVRAVCLDDGTGRGAVVFATIDCVGISNTDIRRVRARLADFAQQNNIAAINISATHCHSAVDTQGLWGDIIPNGLKNNVKAVKEGREEDLTSGRDPKFMNNLYEKASKAITDAFASMKKGKLYSAVTDDLEYMRDKRPPEVVEKDLTSLHFVPDDGSAETYAVFMAAHPVCLGAKNRSLSSDYPFYIVDEFNKHGKNGIFFQGAQLAVATRRDGIAPEGFEGESWQGYGRGIAQFVLGLADAGREQKVKPLLNIKLNEVFIPGKNEVLMLAARLGFVNNRVLRTGRNDMQAEFVTEVGYAQLGENLRIALIPGELAPELAYGGAYMKDKAYRHTDWKLPPMQSMVKDGSKLVVIGLANDSVGYILPGNDYGSVIAPLHYEEAISSGPDAGEIIVKAFSKLVEETGR